MYKVEITCVDMSKKVEAKFEFGYDPMVFDRFILLERGRKYEIFDLSLTFVVMYVLR
jgi:hypothetical protein